MDNGLVPILILLTKLFQDVLILIVVDNGLVRIVVDGLDGERVVLILIVVDNGLVPTRVKELLFVTISLNPYCSGQWSRTRPYKTLLIINKLKNFTKQILTFLNRKLTIP